MKNYISLEWIRNSCSFSRITARGVWLQVSLTDKKPFDFSDEVVKVTEMLSFRCQDWKDSTMAGFPGQ